MKVTRCRAGFLMLFDRMNRIDRIFFKTLSMWLLLRIGTISEHKCHKHELEAINN